MTQSNTNIYTNRNFVKLYSNDINVMKRKMKRSDSVLWKKALTPAEMSKGQSDNTNNATKKFDYTAVADRLRTVSWSNHGHPTGVVNLVYIFTYSQIRLHNDCEPLLESQMEWVEPYTLCRVLYLKGPTFLFTAANMNFIIIISHRTWNLNMKVTHM